MKALIQRVISASVEVEGRVVGSCNEGFMVLVGVNENDTPAEAIQLAQKTAALRVFCDENDKMNLSVRDIDGEILAISQFTLCADTKKGNRPSFISAMEPVRANEYYELYCSELLKQGVRRVEKGIFGADMKVSLINDGPVTIMLDTDIWRKEK